MEEITYFMQAPYSAYLKDFMMTCTSHSGMLSLEELPTFGRFCQSLQVQWKPLIWSPTGNKNLALLTGWP